MDKIRGLAPSIRDTGLFLPTASPDRTPIERAFPKRVHRILAQPAR